MARRDVGVMGGTFDPIHYGHLAAASEVAHLLDLDEVVFVPAGIPWQKKGLPAPAEHRYLMAVIATAADPRFSVSRADIDRDGPTYTVDTLADLREHLGADAHLHLIVGADAVAGIPTWHRPEEVQRIARVVAVTRPGHDAGDVELAGGPVPVVEVPALAISATDIRARVADGRPIDYLVPPGVAAYLRKQGLYRK